MALSLKNILAIEVPNGIPLIKTDKKKISIVSFKDKDNLLSGSESAVMTASASASITNKSQMPIIKKNTAESNNDKINALINSKSEYYTAPITSISVDSISTSSYNQSKAEIMMETILPFFSQQQNFDILKEWLIKDDQQSGKSRRIIEWFLINYAKQYGTVYDIIRGKTLYKFFVSVEYTAALDCYKKDFFDTYCRKAGTVIELDYDNGKKLKTSVAQLNLFRWCIKNCVLDYINNHFDEIQKDLQKRSSSSTKQQITKGKKRHLSNAYNKTLGLHPNINLSVSFDAPTNSISALETNSSHNSE